MPLWMSWLMRLREFCWYLWRPLPAGEGCFSIAHAWEMAVVTYPKKRERNNA